MRAMMIAVLAVGLWSLSSSVRAADENKDLILGVWVITYSDAMEVPLGTKLEFTTDGKLKLTAKDKDGKDETKEIGYKLEKDYIVLTGKDGSKNDKGRICLLNKSSFVINDEIEDKVLVMKRMKAK
jgi:uncharacterized protein (TIGR03066 family)